MAERLTRLHFEHVRVWVAVSTPLGHSVLTFVFNTVIVALLVSALA